MRIGLIDVDAELRGKVTFPNLALMKLSAYHKHNGDTVEWFKPQSGHFDKVYVVKVFGNDYTQDYPYEIDADEVVRGGSGYAIKIVDGHEEYDPELDPPLSYEVEHVMPDYGLYGISDTAYGFLTRGCPRACPFCHVSKMQGRTVKKVADLNEFWDGQKNIKLLDPNITASKDFIPLMQQLAESKAYVDFTQGLDIRLLDKEKIDALNKVRWKMLHFAWDDPYADITPQLEVAKRNLKKWRKQVISCYVLTNFNSTHEQDLHRINTLRSYGVQPYVMIYRKPTAPKETRKLQRWANPFVFWKCGSFDEYQKKGEKHDGRKAD